MRVMKRVMGMLVCLILALAMILPVTASESSSVNEIISEARKGVLQINVYYVEKNGNEIGVQQGSCFLANNKTVVTCEHLLRIEPEYAEKLEAEYNLPFSSNPDALDGKFRYTVAVKRDVEIEATILQKSEEMDFAIMTLENEIGGTTVLPFSDSDSLQATEGVYALGFPGELEVAKGINYYTYQDVSITHGIVSFIGNTKLPSGHEVPGIQHSAMIAGGNSGGPLLNENGEVVGVNDSTLNNNYYFSIQINEIRDILDAFGIVYTKAEGGSVPANGGGGTEEPTTETETSQPETETETQADVSMERDQLTAYIAEAKAVDPTQYTPESVELFQQALTKAEETVSKPDAERRELIAAASDLKMYQDELEEQAGMNITMIAVIAGIVLLVIIAVIIIIVVNSNRRSKPGNRPSMPPHNGGAYPPNTPGAAAGRTQAPMTPPTPQAGTGPAPGETSVLDAGAGETTLLSSNSSNALLIRKKTGEKIQLKGSVFTIGKERSKVNYCITDNTSVSRIHAKLVRKGDYTYLIDQGSTNFTYVNGSKVNAGQEVKLANGDSIKLADETFEFRNA